MSRPETTAPPEIFYSENEAAKYTSSSRIQHIQVEMTLRALDLLAITKGDYVLDIGCGSGLSGEVLTEEGYSWIGLDISPSMLAIALDKEVAGDLFLSDMGQGLPFRPGTFDAAISISAIQWLCNADTNLQNPKKRLKSFFQSLFSSLKRGGKAVLQFYPQNDTQTSSILSAAKTAGFSGGLVVDNAESKRNIKYYLVLSAGLSDLSSSESGSLNLKGVVPVENSYASTNTKKKAKLLENKKEYISRKKELNKRRGKNVPSDSKYSGRKRRPKY